MKITGKNLGENQSQWRTYFYKASGPGAPATAYVGEPEPMTSNLQGSGGSRTSGTRTSGTRTTGTRTSGTGTRTSGTSGRTNNSGNRNSGNTGRTGR